MSVNRELTPGLYRALQYAFKLHGQDARKGTNIPYMMHLLSVCGLVQQDGGSEQQAIAALLHDALEDQPKRTSREEIGVEFGMDVLHIVEICTDTPPGYRGGEKQEWSIRKNNYLKHARTVSPAELLRVTVADKVDNARAILWDYHYQGKQLWGRFNAGKELQLWYYRECLEAYRSAGFSGHLLDEFRNLVRQLAKIINEK
jgi:(p)ppGpp synthase/HD superfamily hydrolase